MGTNQVFEYEVRLKKLREELDLLDEEMVRLLLKRFEITQEVGQTKLDFDMPILDQNREKILLDKIDNQIMRLVEPNSAQKTIDLQNAIRHIYETVLIHSKELQKKIELKL